MCDEIEQRGNVRGRDYRGAFFLHIPKTAGTALTDTFSFSFRHFLRDAHLPGSRWQDVVAGEESFFVSGHFSFCEVTEMVERPDVFSFTVLRDPLEQVVSNIRWVKAYGDPARAEKLSEISPSIADLAKRLWEVSLSDVDWLGALLEGAAGRPFRNVQTVTLQSGVAGQCEGGPEGPVATALRNMKRFSFFFVLEDITRAHEVMSQRLGPLEPLKRSNAALLDERPSLDRPEVREFYRSLVEQDLELYAVARDVSRARMGAWG